MRVVLIAYHFPPDPAVGSLRAAKVARTFVEAGHRVEVVTARLPKEIGTRPTDSPALTIHPVSLMPGPRDISARISTCLAVARGRHRGAPGASQAVWTPPSHLTGWKRLVSALLWLPDDRQGFIVPGLRKARALIRGGGADLLYSTAPPFSPHLVGLLAKWITGVRWILELRDPWADNDQKPWWVRTRATDTLDAGLERLCLTRADLVVTVSEGIRRRIQDRLSTQHASRCVVVRNGIEHLRSTAPSERQPGPVRIVHAGTFYYGRDPRPFLRGLAAFCHKRKWGPDQIRVDFVGACRTVGPVSVEREIAALGLRGIVHIHDWLPQAAAHGFVEEADVLLLLAQQQPDQVPNKLYEYLGSRRPILAFADATGETARMLRQVGGHHVLTGAGGEDVERALEEVLVSAMRPASAGTNDMLLKEWTTEVQMQQLLAAIHSVRPHGTAA